MDDNWMIICKNRKKWKIKYLQAIWMASKTLVQKLDMDITGEQARWIKYRTRFYKKMKKKKKLV